MFDLVRHENNRGERELIVYWEELNGKISKDVDESFEKMLKARSAVWSNNDISTARGAVRSIIVLDVLVVETIFNQTNWGMNFSTTSRTYIILIEEFQTSVCGVKVLFNQKVLK